MDKDVRRTDRGVPFFAGSRNPNVAMLRRILLTYSIYNFDLSYCQVCHFRIPCLRAAQSRHECVRPTVRSAKSHGAAV